MFTDDEEVVEVSVQVEIFHPARDAIYVIHKNGQCYLPHSQIKNYDEPMLEEAQQTKKPVQLEIPIWLAEKEELI